MSHRALSELQFRHLPHDEDPEIQAVHGEKVVGSLMLYGEHYSPGLHEVNHIGVDPAYRRQGIATALWHKAKELGYNPEHSENQTPEGKAWATAIDQRATLR